MKQQETDSPYKIEKTPEGIVVTAPYNADFVKMARKVGGKWDQSEKTWTFPEERHKLVIKMCDHCFSDKKRPGQAEELFKAVREIAQTFTPGMVRAVRFGAMAVGFGINGMRGIAETRRLMGAPPERVRRDGVSTDFKPSNMGAREWAFERGMGLGR